MKLKVIIVALCGLLLSSCVAYSSTVRTDTTDRTVTTTENPYASFGMVEGVGTAYVAANGIKPFDGTLVRLDLIPIKDQPGELIEIQLWPILELGVGLFGARVHLLPFEVGTGLFFYYPRPRNYWAMYEAPAPVPPARDVDVRVDIDKR